MASLALGSRALRVVARGVCGAATARGARRGGTATARGIGARGGRTAVARPYSSTDVMHRLRPDSASHIDLVEIDRLLFRAPREQLWVPPGGRGIFGGQIMGQALRAATLTLGDAGDAFRCHSFHGYFLQAGDPTRDVLYVRGADIPRTSRGDAAAATRICR